MADSGAVRTLSTARRRGRPRTLDLYLIRGVAGPFLLVTLCVVAAMMLERSVRLAHELASSGADMAYFFPLLVRLAPYYVDLAIPAAFMVALVLLVARLDERLEIEAMLASGITLARLALPLAGLASIIALISLATGGWLEPHGRYGFRSMRIEAINAGRLGSLPPGAIHHPTENLAVTFDRRGEGRVFGLFLWQRLPDGRELTSTGRSGRIGFVPRERMFGIDVDRGRQLGQPPAPARPYLVGFDRLLFQDSLRLQGSSWQRGWDHNEMTLPELIRADRQGHASVPRHALQAEYASRIARAATILLIPFIVLPLAFATKKGRRGLGIVLGGVLLAFFHHGMNMVRQLGLAGAVEPIPAIATATFLSAALIFGLFYSSRHLPSHSPIHDLLAPLAWRVRPWARRSRALPSPSGRTLAFYVGWQLGKWTLLALLAVVAMLQMVDIFEQGGAFVARGLGPAGIATYAWLRLPALVQQAMPIAALAGALMLFSGLVRSSEMVAVRAMGISQFRLLAMTLPVAASMALVLLFLAEVAAPRSELAFASWWEGSAPEREEPASEARWFRIGGDIVRARIGAADGGALRDLSLFRRDEEGLLAERIDAAAAQAGANGWRLRDVDRIRIRSGRVESERIASLDWPVALRGEDVAAFFSSVPLLSSAAARRSMEARAPVSRPAPLFATRLYRAVAEPIAPLVMIVLALPLAFLPPRAPRAWPALLYAVGGGLLYLATDGILTVSAQVGYLPPIVGACTAPLVGLLTGLTVLLYSER